MSRDWDREYDAKFQQRLADMAQEAYVDYAGREDKRRQMCDTFEPLRPTVPEKVATWWKPFAVLLVILLILQWWDHDIYFR